MREKFVISRVAVIISPANPGASFLMKITNSFVSETLSQLKLARVITLFTKIVRINFNDYDNREL